LPKQVSGGLSFDPRRNCSSAFEPGLRAESGGASAELTFAAAFDLTHPPKVRSAQSINHRPINEAPAAAARPYKAHKHSLPLLHKPANFTPCLTGKPRTSANSATLIEVSHPRREPAPARKKLRESSNAGLTNLAIYTVGRKCRPPFHVSG